MVKVKRKFLFFKVNDQWFTYTRGIRSALGINAFFHIKEELKNPLLVKVPNFTVALDLTKSKEQILDGFSRTLNRLVRNAEKENIHCYFEDNIPRFVNFFNEFAVQKGLPKESEGNISCFGNAVKIGFAELNGQIMAAHLFIKHPDKKIARLMLSSSKRFDENFDSNMIGKANKYLYYWEMLAFKDMGLESFDFGGYQEVNSDKVIESLLKFKLDFGAEKIITKNYFTLPYYLMKKTYLLMGLARKN